MPSSLSEDLALAILKTLPYDLLVLDAESKVLFSHGGFVLRDETFEPRDLPDLFQDWPLLAGILRSLLAEARDTGSPASTVVWLGASGAPDRCCRAAVARLHVSGDAKYLGILEDQSRETHRDLQLGLLRRINERLAGTFDLDRILFSILTGVTAGHGLGFSRALLFLLDESTGGDVLTGRMAVGAATREDALRIWAEIDRKNLRLEDLLDAYDRKRRVGDESLTHEIQRISISVPDDLVLGACLRERRPILVDAGCVDPRVNPQLKACYGADRFVAVPLLARDRALGVILADRQWSSRPLAPEDVAVLRLFVGQAGMAIVAAEAQRRAVRSEKLATVGQLAAKLAHEIRNPLTIIGGFVRTLLRDGPSSPHFARNLQIVSDEVKRLEGMLSDVKDFVRPVTPRAEPVDLNSLVKTALDQVAAVTDPGARIRFEADLGPLGDPALVDPAQMRQVLLNLLRNAVEAIEARGDENGGLVRVRTRRDRGRIRIEVEDDGCGVPAESLSRLFDPFFSTKSRGSGLGLSVTARILEDHGGSISARSEAMRGTTMIAVIPDAGTSGRNPMDSAQDPGASGRAE